MDPRGHVENLTSCVNLEEEISAAEQAGDFGAKDKEIAEGCTHETTFFSLESQADERCIMELAGERYWTEVRETEFVDSRDYQPPTRLIDHSKVRIGEKMAEGGQGTIYAAHYVGDQVEFNRVLKVFNAAPGSSPQGQWPDDAIFTHSPFLCSLQGFIHQPDGSFALLMDRYDGDLRTLINERMERNKCKNPKPFDVAESLSLIGQIAMGMKALHTHGITHRDMKTANVLINLPKKKSKGVLDGVFVYIGDFESSSDVVGTGFWRSPEVLQALKERKHEMVSAIYTPKSDVYSFGMTCYEILTGKIPLNGYPLSQYDVVLCEKKRPELPEDLDPKLRDLISRCWHQDPDARPTSTEIVAELKEFVEALDIAGGIYLISTFGVDEGFNGETSTLEADLSELQELLHASQASLSVEGFACGCEFVSLANKFLEKFNFGITEENIATDAEWWDLIAMTDEEKVIMFMDHFRNVTWTVAHVTRSYTFHLCGRIWGQCLKLVYESIQTCGALKKFSTINLL